MKKKFHMTKLMETSRCFETITCQQTGYSQSKSNPSKLCFKINSMTCSVNFLLAAGLFTNRLYLSPWESFQPPIAIVTLMPCFLYAATCS